MHIKLSRLSCGYHQKTVIHDLTLEILPKEHLTILGSNGSGKSTLAKALAGLLSYEGKLDFNGQELKEMDAQLKAKSVAYIPSKLESFDSFTTVEDFVLMGRFPHKEPFRDYSLEDKAMVQAILTRLHISDLASNTLHDLSSGQQQLVLISQALAQESRVIIFDEPTSNLDPRNSLFFSQLLENLQQTHTTLLITHDLNLAYHTKGAILFLQNKNNHYFDSAEKFFNDETLSAMYEAPVQLLHHIPGISYA